MKALDEYIVLNGTVCVVLLKRLPQLHDSALLWHDKECDVMMMLT